MLRQKPSAYLLFFLSLVLYIVIGYGIQRHQTVALFVGYFSVFLIYVRILQFEEYKFWMIAAIIFRAVLLFSVPALSDDFYRFIWDGRLLAGGVHPFAEVPSYYMRHGPSIPGINADLFNKLNSKETFTIYPPFSQFIFWLSVRLSSGSVFTAMVVMKVIIFGFEMGTLWILPKIARYFGVPSRAVLIYALNPLVILELTGNLHFEGVMIFFLLLAIFFLIRPQLLLSALAYSISICTKLIPLLFLPLLLRHFGWKKTVAYWSLTAAFTILFFSPLLNGDIVHGMSTSIGYYFQRFEFNASIYYLIRQLGYLLFGFNIIYFAGPLLAFSATAVILTIAFKNLPSTFPGRVNVSLPEQMLWCLLAYFLSTTILHPWYIITLLTVSVFTAYRFGLLWSALIFLTYEGYRENFFMENLVLVATEYVAVISYLLYETVWMKRRNRF